MTVKFVEEEDEVLLEVEGQTTEFADHDVSLPHNGRLGSVNNNASVKLLNDKRNLTTRSTQNLILSDDEEDTTQILK